MSANFDEFLLEQVRQKDMEIYRLRMELLRYKAAELDVELEFIPTEWQVQ